MKRSKFLIALMSMIITPFAVISKKKENIISEEGILTKKTDHTELKKQIHFKGIGILYLQNIKLSGKIFLYGEIHYHENSNCSLPIISQEAMDDDNKYRVIGLYEMNSNSVIRKCIVKMIIL